MTNVLVCGGAGYIGSHTVLALAQAGYRVVVLDNFSNSHPAVMPRLRQLSGQALKLVQADVMDTTALEQVMREHSIGAVMQFAGLKSVADSVADPAGYLGYNLGTLSSVLLAMERAGVQSLVFSSSATVYGEPASSPVREDAALMPMNPYGMSKALGEAMLAHACARLPGLRVAALRYFNPVGAHESGQIGEDPRGTPANLMPCIGQVATGRRELLQIFGDDYPTPDGSAQRDYIHVVDLADGHVAALRKLGRHEGLLTLNLGTGTPVSVHEMVSTFKRVNGLGFAVRVVARRPGDVPAYWADPSRAQALLGWHARRSLEDMCRDAWRWQQSNPQGYDSVESCDRVRLAA